MARFDDLVIDDKADKYGLVGIDCEGEDINYYTLQELKEIIEHLQGLVDQMEGM